MIRGRLHRVAMRGLDWLYPRQCAGCDEVADWPGRHICTLCRAELNLYEYGLCRVCGAPAEGGVQHSFTCSICERSRPAFTSARAAGYFRGTIREMVHLFKYSNALWLKDDLCDLLEGALRVGFDPALVDVVVPVPLHLVRERERSYNQAAILAQELAARIGRRYDGSSLKRQRATTTQTRLNIAERKSNIAGAFMVVRPGWIEQRRILLVDDVMTTGATLHECAKVLRKAGAREVWAVTVARG